MRALLNVWLRRWAEASLRTELHQAQEKLIRQQNASDRLLAHAQKQASDHSKKIEKLKINHRANVAYNEKLIKSLRDRMPADLFLSICEYTRSNSKNGGDND